MYVNLMVRKGASHSFKFVTVLLLIITPPQQDPHIRDFKTKQNNKTPRKKLVCARSAQEKFGHFWSLFGRYQGENG